MEMTSFSFLLYLLPVMLVVYFALRFSVRLQNLWLVISTLFFYAWGNHYYTLLLIGLVTANYFLGYGVHYAQEKRMGLWPRRLLIATVVLNVLPLLFFNHLPVVLTMIMGLPTPESLNFPAAPLGIAFLALQGISFVVDTYRQTVPWRPDFINAALYLSFFPFLQAGPIIRYQDVADELLERKFDLDEAVNGLCRLVVGLGKIVLLATPLMSLADIIFNQSNLSALYTKAPISLAILGLVAFAVSLYHYLTGFSDLVIGLGRILGFHYPENFRYPQFSPSVGEFWERCYITLGDWFAEYVYKPLGKTRTNNDWMIVHVLLVWVLIGLWVGAGVPKIIFGAWTFVFILIEKIVEVEPDTQKSIFRNLYVIFYLIIALIALKTDSVYQFTLFIGNLFGMRGSGFQSELALFLLRENWLVLVVGFIATFPVATKLRARVEALQGPAAVIYSVAYPLALAGLLALTVITISGWDYNPYLMIQQHLWS